MLNHPFILQLINKLQEPLPGIDAQFEMAHINREKVKIKDMNLTEYRNSAVLLLLIKRGNGFYIPLTERHEYKGLHSGQISFPGGKADEKDLSLEQTALRECYEEIGIGKGITIIGSLTPVYIPVSRFMVNPFVGILSEEKTEITLNTTEVKNLLELEINDLKNPAMIKQTVVEPSKGYKLKTPYFDVQGKIVWGATAMILNEFKKLI